MAPDSAHWTFAVTRDIEFARLVRDWPKLSALTRSSTHVDWAAAERRMVADFRKHWMTGRSVPAGKDPAAVFEERKGRVAEVFRGVRKHYGAGRDMIVYAPRENVAAGVGSGRSNDDF